jgi:[protein-PII] uridylyltransferase
MIDFTPDPNLQILNTYTGSRMEYIRFLRDFLQQEKEKIIEQHRRGAGGKEISKYYSLLVDKILERSYSLAMPSSSMASNLTLVAIGGYGRAELSLYSDVDILFLYGQKIYPSDQDFIEKTICLLWDIKLQVGHSCRSINDCVNMAKVDLTVKTALLEARYLLGSQEVFAAFHRTLQKEIIEKGVKDFIRQKIEEQNQRYSLYEGTANLLEPNVKESPGGLRDYHTACWLLRAKYPTDLMEALTRDGTIYPEEREIVDKAYDFLLRIRNEIHLTCQKKSDILALQIQDKIAHHLGYHPTNYFTRAENFMKEYYTQANIIKKFSSTVINRCQEEKGLRKVISYISRKDLGWGLYIAEGELRLKRGSERIFQKNPVFLMEVFVLAAQKNLGFSQELKQFIKAHLYLVNKDFRENKEVAQKFFALLKEKKAAPALRQMHELGILGRYIPEFGEITCLIQHDLYHKYTIDEHCLRGIEALEELLHSPSPELTDLAQIYQNLPHPEIVKLALLLHDLGKSQGPNHAQIGALMVKNILKNLYLPEIVKDKVELLVQHHILMNEVAQRRDLQDRETIRQFAGVVKDIDNLERLYLLTYADLKAVGPGIWTVWKGALLWELYHKTRDYLSRGGEEVLSGEEFLMRLRQELVEELIDEIDPAEIDKHLERMPYKYILSMPVEKIADHIRLIDTLYQRREGLVLSYRHNPEIGYTEIMVCTHDRPGIFSQIAGVLASKDINILGAQIYTGKDGIAIDTLQVTILEETLWKGIKSDLAAILRGEELVQELVDKRKKTFAPLTVKKLTVPTKVKLDNRISDTHTVIEIFTQDRLGLLFDITNTLYKLGINIYLAKISTEFQKAIDVFYVTNMAGEKIMAEEDLLTIKEALLQTLNQ